MTNTSAASWLAVSLVLLEHTRWGILEQRCTASKGAAVGQLCKEGEAHSFNPCL